MYPLAQIILGIVRPHDKASPLRQKWLWAHRIFGVASLGLIIGEVRLPAAVLLATSHSCKHMAPCLMN